MERTHRMLGLTDDEFDDIVALLDREPSDLELAMYAVMWSEHCSYKSSRRHLSRFPIEAPWVLVGPGEGAGVIDVGEGQAVAIRIESHNHPSAVEPHQGAATGVGGIIRDVFSMGARPIALMDSLRFGPLTPGLGVSPETAARNRYLVEGVVSGISSYGNSVGVPTVGGEIVFDSCYSANPLVNVLCLGVLPTSRLVLARAEGEGNLAVLLGASTGRDGIGGASVLASAGFVEGETDKRPSVQVGDPFEEKKLIEACLALLDSGLAVGVQDLGAAGLSCAASETAAKAGAGMDVDVARVARREPGMTPVEVMTSESQERMLAIVRPDDLGEVLSLCRRWEIRASVVGRVTGTGRFRVFDGLFDGDTEPVLLADVPAGSLGDGPDYDRPMARPADQDDRLAADPWPKLFGRFPPGTDLGSELLELLGSPGVGDPSWVWRQYDHQLFLNTVAGPGADAAVLRLKDTTGKALALTTDGKARFCRLDPRMGGALVVLEAARNVACAGARPLALVNCLNFGNPEHSEVMWQFSEVVDGMAEACRELEIPVVGGNVSFYNESGGEDIDPTPVVGVVGLLDALRGSVSGARLAPGERIVLLGTTAAELGGSEWAARHGLVDGPPPAADLEAAFRLHPLVAALVAERVVAGVHDCSDGGLAVTLAEMAIAGDCGFAAAGAGDLEELPPAAVCFSESANRVVLAVDPDRVAEVFARARDAGVACAELGVAGGDRLVLEGCFDVSLDEAASAWRHALPSALAGEAVPTAG
jgi:phosphoribosylformylglycinamidine synthase